MKLYSLQEEVDFSKPVGPQGKVCATYEKKMLRS